MGINVILKYKRECDCWLCPECDTENNISASRCTVCGCQKSASATILKQWTEADERPVNCPPKSNIPPTHYTPPKDTKIFTDTDKDTYIPEEETNTSKIFWFVIFIIFIFILVAIILRGY